jgi:D-serine deaminase-like pyridoxal phosphate-dependent protein
MPAIVDIDQITTPALLLDLELFEANLQKLSHHCRNVGCRFRPHAKTHKSPWIARRQLESGAAGVSVATVAEAELMVHAGIRNVLLTSPIVQPGKIRRMIELAKSDEGLLLAVSSLRQAELLEQMASAAGIDVNVLVDIDVGDGRTGIEPGEPALRLAEKLDAMPRLKVKGIQAYSGTSSHVVGFADRKRTSLELMAKAAETRELFERAGIEATIVSGGSTGTYNIDSDAGLVTELQVGSYVFMDADYRRIGGRDCPQLYDDFSPALSAVTTVVSRSSGEWATVDAGVKALSPDTGCAPEVIGRPDLKYEWFGDEFGLIKGDGKLPELGERIRLVVPHCDPTVNMYEVIYLTRGDAVEGAIRIGARRGDRTDGVEIVE